MQQEGRYWFDTLREFVEERQGRFSLIGLIFIAALVGALVLRRRGRAWDTEDVSLDAARHVASRPVSSALAITLVCMAFVIPRAVGPVSDVVALLALVPILRLGIGLVAPHIRRLLYGVTAVVILQLLTTFAPDGTVLRRLLILIVTTVGLIGATQLVRRWRRTGVLLRARTARIGLVGLQLATGLLAVSLAANLLGWFALSEMLLKATVVSAYSGMAWLVVMRALTALVPVVPRSVVGTLMIRPLTCLFLLNPIFGSIKPETRHTGP